MRGVFGLNKSTTIWITIGFGIMMFLTACSCEEEQYRRYIVECTGRTCPNILEESRVYADYGDWLAPVIVREDGKWIDTEGRYVLEKQNNYYASINGAVGTFEIEIDYYCSENDEQSGLCKQIMVFVSDKSFSDIYDEMKDAETQAKIVNGVWVAAYVLGVLIVLAVVPLGLIYGYGRYRGVRLPAAWPLLPLLVQIPAWFFFATNLGGCNSVSYRAEWMSRILLYIMVGEAIFACGIYVFRKESPIVSHNEMPEASEYEDLE